MFRAENFHRRGIPLLAIYFVIFFSMPLLVGVGLPAFWAAVVGLGIRSSAYQSQIFRSGIQAVGEGQIEAALSLGMSRIQMIRHVTFPQALRIMLPSWTNEMVYLLKYSSLAMLLAVPELMYNASVAASETFLYAQIYLIVAGIYLVFATLIIQAMRRVEVRLHIPGVTTIKR